MRSWVRILLGCLLLAGLAACQSKGYRAPADTLDRCFWEPWRPNC
jgi:hypothetical protein